MVQGWESSKHIKNRQQHRSKTKIVIPPFGDLVYIHIVQKERDFLQK